MKYLILCEGKTDVIFLQYYMRTVNQWNDYKKAEYSFSNNFSRELKRDDDILTIASVGGCSKLDLAIKDVLNYEKTQSPGKAFSKIVVISDNDDSKDVDQRHENIKQVFLDEEVKIGNDIFDDKWHDIQMVRTYDLKEVDVSFLFMEIPFDENGAIETFLLHSIARNDGYDAEIIRKGKEYVYYADPESRYLKGRRDKIKAEYEVYFDIRTIEMQFIDRQNILKGIPWEEYSSIQGAFRDLNEL